MSKVRALLLTGGADYHNQTFHIAELAGILAHEAGADLRITDDLDALHDARSYDVVVNWSTFLKPEPAQVASLISAVEGGVGLFAIHAGAATFWNDAAYLRMLGSRFLKHDPYKQFRVEVVVGHPITAGVESFDVEDELYQQGGNAAEFDELAAGTIAGRPNAEMRHLGAGPLASDITVLASAEGWPLLYVKTHGKGRVHYNALGHDQKALQHPAFRQLVCQGLAWAAGR